MRRQRRTDKRAAPNDPPQTKPIFTTVAVAFCLLSLRRDMKEG
jgi:hypothetical protein